MHGPETPGTANAAATPDALRPPPGNPRFPAVDGLRALAALMVLAGHTSFLSGVNGHGHIGAVLSRFDLGVALFFIISGFLLYRPFVAARLEARRPPRVLRYGRRRLLRIVPAYWLALTVLAIWPGLHGDVFGHPFVYYLFLQDLQIGWIQGGITATWSLCVEMQFYLLLPLYALGIARLLRGRDAGLQLRVELLALAALGAASFALRTWAYDDPRPDTISWTVAGSFLWFAFGMAMATASARWHGAADRPRALALIDRRPLLPWAVAIVLLFITTRIGLPTAAPQFYSKADWFWEHLLYGLIAVALAAPATLALPSPRALPQRLLTLRPVAWLGLVSYGIFLWHHPLTEQFIRVQDWTSHGSYFVYTGVVLAVATAFAAASYYLVERPLLRFKDPRPKPPRAPSAPADPDRVELVRAV
jgi:peptidoglycan/LPS O-acetylase OafA/YrhL